MVGLLLVLSACNQVRSDASAVQPPAAPAPPDDAVMTSPGLPASSDTFSPSNTSTTQGGHYYGYN